jgi:hypothetical protein
LTVTRSSEKNAETSQPQTNPHPTDEPSPAKLAIPGEVAALYKFREKQFKFSLLFAEPKR